MVSYFPHYNSKNHSAANLAYPAGQWQWPANYHTPPNHQFLSDMDSPHAPHHQMYYNPHPMFHPAAGPATEWHSPTSSADNFSQNSAASATHHMLHPQHGIGGVINGGSGSTSSASSGSSSASAGPISGNTQLNETTNSISEQQQQQRIAEGLPSPPITVSGSEISSPGVPASSSSPHHVSHIIANNNNNSPSTSNNNNNTSIHNNNNNRSSPVKAQYYEWMKKPSYPAQPTPGKTRTKDKYRVVYTDFQRLELEKEYCTSRYITIRRKTELAQSLSLSERQVKIWFQNRRAKERKQNKKGNDPTVMVGGHPDYANLMEAKPKLEPGLHLQHPHSQHSMSSMAAMNMPMGLHHHLHSHHPLAMSAAAAHCHQLTHQMQHSAQMSAAAAASVNSLTM